MVQPVQDERQLQDLDRIESTQALRPEFRDELAELQRKLFDGRAKSVRRVPLSAAAFAGLLDRYAAAFNEGKHPRIISCWDAVQHEETSRVLEECKAQLAVKAREIEAGLPLEDDELAKAQAEVREEKWSGRSTSNKQTCRGNSQASVCFSLQLLQQIGYVGEVFL